MLPSPHLQAKAALRPDRIIPAVLNKSQRGMQRGAAGVTDAKDTRRQ